MFRSITSRVAAITVAGALTVLSGCDKDKTTEQPGTNPNASTNPSTTPASGGAAANPNEHVFKAPDGAVLKLAFVTNNASDYWKIAAAGVKKYADEAGIQVDVKEPNKTVAEQKQIIENLLSQGYNGITVSVISPTDETDFLNSTAAKTNVLTMDSDAPNSNRLLYIGTNNFEAGKVLGKEIMKLLPHGGKMAVFVGTLSADNASKRLGGIEAAFKEGNANIDIVARKEDNEDRTKARSNVEDVMNAYPDIGVLVGLWSYNGPAIASAVDGAGKKGKVQVAVFDQEAGTLAGIASGTVSCTVAQKPFTIGYLSAKYMDELATKGASALPADRNVDTGVEVVNSDNIAAYTAKMAQMQK